MFKSFKKFNNAQKAAIIFMYVLVIFFAVFIFINNSKRVSEEKAAAEQEITGPVITAVAKDLYEGVEGHELHHVAMVINGYGIVEMELDATAAPETVNAFLELVKNDFYREKAVYRIVEGFICQCGDHFGKSAPAVHGEFSANGFEDNYISHVRGTVSLSRGDEYDSGTSEFFICQSDCTELDGQYAAFGWVTSGMEVLDQIHTDAAQWGTNRFGYIIQPKDRPIIAFIELID